MARVPSYPGPYVIKFPYGITISSLTINHTHTINCKPVGEPVPGSTPASILLVTGGGGTKSLQEAVTQYWSFLRLMIANSASISNADFFAVEPEGYEETFITSVALLPATTSGGAAVAAREDTLTFRSAKGSYMQINIIEPQTLGDTKLALVPNAAGSPHQRMAAYVMSADNVATCRDRSFPIGCMRVSNTQNEATYKKRFRAS